MIYSDAFNALPDHARDAVYKRLWQVLSGSDSSPRYARLSTADRQAIVEILRDTKKDLPLPVPIFKGGARRTLQCLIHGAQQTRANQSSGKSSAQILPSPMLTRIGPGHIPAMDHPIPNSTPPAIFPPEVASIQSTHQARKSCDHAA